MEKDGKRLGWEISKRRCARKEKPMRTDCAGERSREGKGRWVRRRKSIREQSLGRKGRLGVALLGKKKRWNADRLGRYCWKDEGKDQENGNG